MHYLHLNDISLQDSYIFVKLLYIWCNNEMSVDITHILTHRFLLFGTKVQTVINSITRAHFFILLCTLTVKVSEVHGHDVEKDTFGEICVGFEEGCHCVCVESWMTLQVTGVKDVGEIKGHIFSVGVE